MTVRRFADDRTRLDQYHVIELQALRADRVEQLDGDVELAGIRFSEGDAAALQLCPNSSDYARLSDHGNRPTFFVSDDSAIDGASRTLLERPLCEGRFTPTCSVRDRRLDA